MPPRRDELTLETYEGLESADGVRLHVLEGPHERILLSMMQALSRCTSATYASLVNAVICADMKSLHSGGKLTYFQLAHLVDAMIVGLFGREIQIETLRTYDDRRALKASSTRVVRLDRII